MRSTPCLGTPALAAHAGQFVMARTSGTVRRIQDGGRGAIRFTLCGEFDISNHHQLRSVLEGGLGSRMLTIDLARTTYIDASVIGIFARLAAHRRARRAARLRLANANPHLHRLFVICNLDEKCLFE